MGNKNNKARLWNTPKSVQAIKPKIVVNPWFSQLAKLLAALRPKIDGRVKTSFSPDPWALQSLWPSFMEELNFNERFAISQDLQNQGLEVLTKLFSIRHMVVYDSFTRSVFKTFQKKVLKNTLNTPLIDGFKYLIAFFVFLQNGPKLSFEHEEMQVDTEINGHNTKFSIYAIIEALKVALSELSDNSIDLDLLVFWINNLDLQDSASIKHFCELPLTDDEALQTLIPLKTPNNIRRFKERVFHKGPWYTSSALIFTSVNERPINYRALLKKLIEVKKNRGFKGLKNVQTKEIQLQTYFSGVRVMPEYQITVQRWIFTDLYEADILALYLDENIEELEKLSAKHPKASSSHQ